MKYFLFFVLISSSAFAIDFNKVTGTFDVAPHEHVPETESTYLTGTFEGTSHENRMPASTDSKKEVREQNVTELTGTFR